MAAAYRETVEDVLDRHFGDRVYSIEDGIVWVSGMNSGCKSLARRMAHRLVQSDVPCSPVYDDDAEAFGGVQFNYGPRDDTRADGAGETHVDEDAVELAVDLPEHTEVLPE